MEARRLRGSAPGTLDGRLDRLCLGLGPVAADPAQDSAHPRHHFARRERLQDVIVRPHLQADDAVGLLVAAGQHDHRDVRARPQAAQEVEAASVGQNEVEDDEIGPGDALLGLAKRGRLGDGESVPLEREGEALADGRLVVDDENQRDRGSHGGAPNGPGGGCA